MNDSALISALADICGEKHVLPGADVPPQYTVDWMNDIRGVARAVVSPADVPQVSALMRYCTEHRIPVVPQGGHTGMSGGATPSASGREIVLSLRRLNKIRAVNAVSRSLTAEAGCLLIDIQQKAAEEGLYFPLDLGAKESCQLGGNLATNAGGLNVLRYGSARDLCLGLEAVLPDGRVLNLLSDLKKDNSGYDLKGLLVGSEGTLAVLTAATLKLFPPAPPLLTAWARPPSVEAALELLEELQAKTGGAVSAFELLRPPMFSLLEKYAPEATLPLSPPPEAVQPPPLALLVELSGGGLSEEAALEVVAEAQQRGLLLETLVAQSESQRRDFWRVREMAPAAKARHGAWVHGDVSLPLDALPAFLRDMDEQLPALSEGMYVAYGHLGDGNLHIGLRPKDEDPAQNPQLTAAVSDALYERVAFYGGSFSAEHGIGRRKIGVMEKYKSPVALEVMRQIKQVFDPHNIMNPGRMLRPSSGN